MKNDVQLQVMFRFLPFIIRYIFSCGFTYFTFLVGLASPGILIIPAFSQVIKRQVQLTLTTRATHAPKCDRNNPISPLSGSLFSLHLSTNTSFSIFCCLFVCLSVCGCWLVCVYVCLSVIYTSTNAGCWNLGICIFRLKVR